MEDIKKKFDRDNPVITKSSDEAVKAAEVNVSPPAIFEGTVTNCLSLNLRAEPKADARVLAELKALDKITVNLDKSTDEFYSVRSSSGVKGYCMRQFIAVKK